MLQNRALAPTTFFTGPEDDLATADVYDIKSDAVINDIAPPPSLDADKITQELQGGKSMLANLPMLTSAEIFAKAEVASEWKVVSPTTSMPGIGGLKASVAGDGKGFIDTLKNMGTSVYKALGGVNGVKTLLNSDTPTLLNRLSSGTLGIPGLAGNPSLSSLGNVLGSKNTPQAMQALLNSPIPSQLGAYATSNGVTTRLPAGNLGQSYQFSSLMNNVLPSSSQVNVVDKDSTARLISAFAVGGMSSGVPNAFSSAMPLAGGDMAILAKSAQISMNYASGTGNIKGMSDVVKAVGPTNLVGMGKTVFSNFSKSFQGSTDAAPNGSSQAKQDFTEVTQTFSKIDPDWMKAPVNPNLGYEVVDLSTGFEGSPGFQSMMDKGARASDDNGLKCFTMTSMFDLGTPEQELKKQFPMTVTSVTTETTPNIDIGKVPPAPVRDPKTGLWNTKSGLPPNIDPDEVKLAAKLGYVSKGIVFN